MTTNFHTQRLSKPIFSIVHHHFNKDYFSHKFHHAGVRYEIGICIATGWIVWINGPFPCGAWPDLRIARSSLHDALFNDEMYIARLDRIHEKVAL